MLQTFTFTGAGRQINAQASYFKYESGSAGGADESVSVRVDGQALGEYYPGDSVRLPVAGVLWEITPANAACAGRVRLGVGQVESSRLVGNVKVIDQSADQTMALSQFVAMNSVQDATKGVIVGLWAQSKQMIIRSIQFGSNATTGIALVTGTGRPINGQGTAPVPANKMVGSPAAASALPVSGTMAGAHPTTSADLPGAATIGYFSAQANILYRLELKSPLIVPAGRFFGFSTGAANASVNFIAEIEE